MKAEEWKAICGYEGLYEVSNLGRARSMPRVSLHGKKAWHLKEHILKPVKNINQNKKPNTAYCRVRLYKQGKWKSLFVHRLVAEAFIPNPDGKGEVNHIDGNRTNNIVTNLEWVTQSENGLHRIYQLRGKTNNQMELVPVMCCETKECFKSISEAARHHNVTPGRIWQSITYGYHCANCHFVRLYEKVSERWMGQLSDEIRHGYIRVATHPNLPLKIYNYTKKTQFENRWNDVTRKCRGLVLDGKRNIIIQSPEKFFNVGEKFAPKLDLTKCDLLYKADGFYIAVKPDPIYGLIVTSRGSFSNKYTHSARRLLDSQNILPHLVQNTTYFFELLQDFPEDFGLIVARHPIPKLVLWGAKGTDYKEIPIETTGLACVKKIPFSEMKKFLSGTDEGLVARDSTTGQRVKLKTSYYLRTHRIISDCTKLRVWEIVSQGGQVEDLDIPDEYMQQMLAWQDELRSQFEKVLHEVDMHEQNLECLSDKELGLCDLPQPWKAYVFLRRKDKEQELYDLIWRNIRPKMV